MSLSRSATTVTWAAAASTRLLCSAVAIQRWDSLFSVRRFWWATLTRPRRVQMRPATRPRQPPVPASSASMACNNTPRPPPLPILPSPRRRFGVVLKLNSLVSWTARTCRPATATAVCSPQPSIRRAAVTLVLAKNRPKPTCAARRPRASRRRHTLGRATMRRSSVAPFYRDDDLQTDPIANFAATSRHPGSTKVSHPESCDSPGREPRKWDRVTLSHQVPRSPRCVHPLVASGRGDENGHCKHRERPFPDPPPQAGEGAGNPRFVTQKKRLPLRIAQNVTPRR